MVQGLFHTGELGEIIQQDWMWKDVSDIQYNFYFTS